MKCWSTNVLKDPFGKILLGPTVVRLRGHVVAARFSFACCHAEGVGASRGETRNKSLTHIDHLVV
jgi:hypothetical protein